MKDLWLEYSTKKTNYYPPPQKKGALDAYKNMRLEMISQHEWYKEINISNCI